MATIEIELENAQVTRTLGELVNRLANPRPLMAGISVELLAQVERRFQDEGPGWPQLKPATVRRRGSAHPMLQVTNALARSFANDFGDDYAGVGSSSPYAAIHFFGGKINIPSRSQQAYFRQNKKTGEVGNRFVRKRQSNFAQRVTIPAYTINMPARPMLPVDEQGNLLPTAAEAIMGIFVDFVTN